MMKSAKFSTRLMGTLLLSFSLLGGLICLLTFDVTNLLYSGDDMTKWWDLRLAVFKMGAGILALSLKTFEGRPKFNVGVNAFVLICASDAIGGFTGDHDRDVWDFIWVAIIILLTIYEYRKRRVRT